MRRRLQDMVVVITGASSGIGRALAVGLGQRGAKMVLAARRLDRLEELNRSLGGGHLCVGTDVSCPKNCESLIDSAVQKFGRIDTLVCNAGYILARPFDEMSSDDLRRQFETNWTGTVECCRRAVRLMKQQSQRNGLRGQLMIVSSACARRGLPFLSAYGATKAAQLSLAEGLRVELKPWAIAVTSVHPQVVETELFDVARRRGDMDPTALARGPTRCTAVTAAMVRAVEKPCRELWPRPFSRLSLSMAIALPALVDAVIGRMRDQMLADSGMANPAAAEADDESPPIVDNFT